MINRPPSRFVAACLYACVAMAVLLGGFLWGLRSSSNLQSASGIQSASRSHRVPELPVASNGQAALSFRIHGDSMAPTFRPGDRCRIRPLSESATESLQIGDVVAIRWGGRERIKRVAALEGDEMDRAPSGRLTVNGRRLEAVLEQRAAVLNHPPAVVPVDASRADWQRVAGAPEWVLYTHHNRHQGGRVTAVMDDYPMNTQVRRTLHPVDRLALTITPKDAATQIFSEHRVAVAFYNRARPDHRAVVATMLGEGRARSAIAESSSDIGVEVPESVVAAMDAAHPIAIRIDADAFNEALVEVWREIEYRDDKPTGAVSYPLRIKAGEVFVVGDNLPVSVDSRHVGPLPITSILGVAVRRH